MTRPGSFVGRFGRGNRKDRELDYFVKPTGASVKVEVI